MKEPFVVLFRIVSLLFLDCVGLIIVRRHKNYGIILGFLWLVAIVCVTFIMRERLEERKIVEPFHALKMFTLAVKQGIRPWHYSYIGGIILNILLFVPFGFLLPSIFNGIDIWWKLLFCGILVSFSIEVLQLITLHGFFDVEDILNNTIGSFTGWECYKKWIYDD